MKAIAKIINYPVPVLAELDFSKQIATIRTLATDHHSVTAVEGELKEGKMSAMVLNNVIQWAADRKAKFETELHLFRMQLFKAKVTVNRADPLPKS